MTIRIDRVVTRGGDGGQTSLGDGIRVSKGDARIEAMGTVDELNALIGILEYSLRQDSSLLELADDVRQIQSCLFDFGADLCRLRPKSAPNLTEDSIKWLEEKIEVLRGCLPELTSFILPGGSLISSQAHLVRTVVRRAERNVVELQPTLVQGIKFLNRLSDYFFVLARYVNRQGHDDVLWQPGMWTSRE